MLDYTKVITKLASASGIMDKTQPMKEPAMLIWNFGSCNPNILGKAPDYATESFTKPG